MGRKGQRARAKTRARPGQGQGPGRQDQGAKGPGKGKRGRAPGKEERDKELGLRINPRGHNKRTFLVHKGFERGIYKRQELFKRAKGGVRAKAKKVAKKEAKEKGRAPGPRKKKGGG